MNEDQPSIFECIVGHVRLFLAALEHESFTDAAKALGVGQATMSRRIAALEEEVGHALFDRTPGGLTPTHAALQLRPWAEAMGASMRDAGAALAGLESARAASTSSDCSSPPHPFRAATLAPFRALFFFFLQ